MPNLYIIEGYDAAERTNSSIRFLSDDLNCHEFLSVAGIAYGLSPLDPESKMLLAREIMLERICKLVEQQLDFGLDAASFDEGEITKIESFKGYDLHNFVLPEREEMEAFEPDDFEEFTSRIEGERLTDKIIRGLKYSSRRLLKTKQEQNGTFVFSRNGEIVYVKAKDIKLK